MAESPEERNRILSDPVLLQRFTDLWGSPDGEAALRRAADPERRSPDGSPSPFAGFEIMRQRTFQRDADIHDHDRWNVIAARRAAELEHIDRVTRHVLADAPLPEPPASNTAPLAAAVAPGAIMPEQASPRLRLRGLAAGTGVLVLAAAAAAAIGRSPHPPAPTAAPPASQSVRFIGAPPLLRGTTLTTMADVLPPTVTAERTTFWNSGEDPVGTSGGALGLVLRCRGRGRVTVQISTGEIYPFRCGDAEQTFTRFSNRHHYLPIFVFAPTVGPVLWSLRLTEIPVTPRPGTATKPPTAATSTDGPSPRAAATPA